MGMKSLRSSFFRWDGLGSLSVVVPLIITVVFEFWLLFQGPFEYRGRLGEIFTVYFGVVGVVSAILAHTAMADLHVKIRHLIEMSLQPLRSFAEVLRKARVLVERAEGEIYFVSLVAGFGSLHTCNERVVEEYEASARLSGRNEKYAEAVEGFFEALRDKISKLNRVKMLFLDEDKLGEILDQLKTRDGYESLDVDNVIQVELERRRRLALALGSRKTPIVEGCGSASVLPEQVLIARMADPYGETVYGCLVFLVGSEFPRRERAVGYYIEAKEIASIYMAFVDGLLEEPSSGFVELSARGRSPFEASTGIP